MKGTILHFDPTTQNGVIRAEDGNRYGFAGLDYKSGHAPAAGFEIDFEQRDGVATEIYALKATSAAPLDMTALRRAVAGGTSKVAEHIARNFAADASAAPMARPDGADTMSSRMMSDWRNLLAALALVACFLPFVSVGPFSANLFAVVPGAGLLKTELANLEALMKPFTPPARTTSSNPWNLPAAPAANVQRNDSSPGSTISWTLSLAFLLYAVPLLAVVTLVQVVRGQDNTRPAFWLGCACSALLPAAIVFSSQLSTLGTQTTMFGQLPGMPATQMPGVTTLLGVGFYVLLAAGVGTLLVHTGIIGAAPRRMAVASAA